jgi:hypothetical protein
VWRGEILWAFEWGDDRLHETLSVVFTSDGSNDGSTDGSNDGHQIILQN